MSLNGVVIELDTTGTDPGRDRICSFALLALVNGRVPQEGQLFLLCDPGIAPREGDLPSPLLDDWQLRHQPPFGDYAEEIHALLSKAPVVIAHDAARKLAFLNDEFAAKGLSPVTAPTFCTRQAAADKWPNQSSGLNDCLRRLGLDRQQRRHGASEDAAYVAALYLFFKGEMHPEVRYPAEPMNRRPAPPRPAPLPERPMATT